MTYSFKVSIFDSRVQTETMSAPRTSTTYKFNLACISTLQFSSMIFHLSRHTTLAIAKHRNLRKLHESTES